MEPVPYLYRPLTPEEPLDLSVKRAVKSEAVSPCLVSPYAYARGPSPYSRGPSPYSRGPSPRYGPAPWYDAEYPALLTDRHALPYSPNPSPECAPASPDLGPVDRELIYRGYKAFREEKLHLIPCKAGSNPNMRRAVRRSSGSDDAEYLERRARNNAAAKRSRDRRKGNEVELMLQREFLEQQNAMLETLAGRLEEPCVCQPRAY